jgi:hypothetical protein
MALLADGPARPHDRLWDAVFSPASVWSPGELLAVERRCPGHLPGHTFVPALVLEPRSGTLDQLVDLVEKERGEGEGPEVDFARLRLESRGGWTTRYAEQLPGVADWIIETVQAALEAVYPRSLPPEVTDAAVVAAVLVAGHQPGGYAWPSLVRDLLAGYEPKPDASAVRVLQDCADLGLLGGQLLQRLAEVALENAPGYPDPPSAPRHPLSGVTWDTAGGPVPLLEVPLRRVLAACPASTSAALAEALTGRLWPKSSESMSDRRAEKAYDDRDRFLRSWWKSLVEPTASPRPTFLGALRPGTRKDR